MAAEKTPLRKKIEAAIRKWWKKLVSQARKMQGGPKGKPKASGELWDGVPTVDSKTVTGISPIFERFLGVPLDVRLIKPGGYSSIEEVIEHLVPQMMRDHDDGTSENPSEEE